MRLSQEGDSTRHAFPAIRNACGVLLISSLAPWLWSLDCKLSDFEEKDSPIGYYMDDQKNSAALFDDRFLLPVLLVVLCAWAIVVLGIRP